ncbi:hypothetical protein CONPUDRAFT_83267 [Coniophora puteana RWD-64-598 SS2]|uniref:Extracellular membrane protein CFEM domain-containing protein n=1 Tax=Coniophora puteana (strain RWD-64-598) TaxID=741705 RepID=A0A5M3MIA5_CONPW|nr:uncharacterized protein CONPUDRAFT_83267 [Coniophora puteana RWD-64-598 SS2]EIW78823.1 hypothetical protein CONPUDRAFT_83267 [Coniophora puteana RWD-64-598 SS2]
MLAKSILSILSLAAVVLADCVSNPDPVAISCLQADNRNGNQNCNPDDISCLCKDYVTDGNAQVWNGHCVMDSCQESGNLDQGVSAVGAAQSSICASYTATSTLSTTISATSSHLGLPTGWTSTVIVPGTSTIIVPETSTIVVPGTPTSSSHASVTTTVTVSVNPNPTSSFSTVYVGTSTSG